MHKIVEIIETYKDCQIFNQIKLSIKFQFNETGPELVADKDFMTIIINGIMIKTIAIKIKGNNNPNLLKLSVLNLLLILIVYCFFIINIRDNSHGF